MAEGKKKKTSTVRTRVVSSDDASSSKIKKERNTTKKKGNAKAKTAPKVEQSAAVKPEKKNVSLKDKIKSRQTKKKPATNTKNVGYFKGAWHELRQVRWPNRKATWGLTLAVILYSAFFVVLVLLLDAGFKYLFDFIIK